MAARSSFPVFRAFFAAVRLAFDFAGGMVRGAVVGESRGGGKMQVLFVERIGQDSVVVCTIFRMGDGKRGSYNINPLPHSHPPPSLSASIYPITKTDTLSLP